MKLADNVKMTVTMDVTVSQALALEAMFTRWNQLSSMGSSRNVSFMVDGDGNFHPNCRVKFSSEVPPLTQTLNKIAGGDESLNFDFDGIATSLGLGTDTSEPIKTCRQEEKLIEEKYYELLYAVHNKFPDETRHETALRYIQERENNNQYGPPESCEGNTT